MIVQPLSAGIGRPSALAELLRSHWVPYGLPIRLRRAVEAMTTLDFRVDQKTLDEARRLDLPATRAASFEEDLFRMPTRIQIGETDLFGTTTDPYSRYPIIGLAATGLEVMSDALQGGSSTLWLEAGDLEFTKISQDVQVRSIRTQRIGRAPVTEVIKAWERFAEKVQAFLLREFPDLRQHAEAGAWFRGERQTLV